jgi:integrase
MQEKSTGPLRERVERGIYRRLTRTGDIRYEVAYLDSDGRQRWQTVGSLREARQIRADLVSRVSRGERVAPSRVTLGEYAETWLERQRSRLRPKTLATYEATLRLHLLPRLGRRQLHSITVEDVADLIADLEAGTRYVRREGRLVKEAGKPYAAWTIRGCLTVLGRLLGSAVREGLIAENPVRRLERGERPRVERRQFPSLDRDAIGKLIAATPERYRALVALSVLTGIRQSEALGLQWQDVDLRAGVLRVRRQLDRSGSLVEPKTAAAKREIPLPPFLVRMLQRHKEQAFSEGRARPSDFVFSSKAGTPLGHRNIVRRGLDKALERSGLPRLSWHDLRHVAASALIAEGASVAYVSRVLGHANPSITLSIYAHEFAKAEHADRTRERLEQAFGDIVG